MNHPLSLLLCVLLALALAVSGTVLAVSLAVSVPVENLHTRLPGSDRPPGSALSSGSTPAVRGQLIAGTGTPSTISGQWPCFRGAKHDGICDDGIALARSWPTQGPKQLWSLPLGDGYAGAAVMDGRVYVLDYDLKLSADSLRCLSLDNGQQIWCYRYPLDMKRNHGMSRTVPAVVPGCIVALGPKCHVTALDPVSGKRLWGIDLVAQYAGQCPLIDGDRVILAPGGDDALLLAVDLKTGREIWKTPNPRGWTMTHVSIVPMDVSGRKTYVYCGKGGVVGVSAEDGKVLWETTDWKISIATCPSPVVLPQGRVFCSGGYNSGAVMLQVSADGDKLNVKTIRRFKPGEFGSTQQTPIFYRDHLYGVREKDKMLVCMDANGKEVWASGSEHRFGSAPYLVADGLLYVLDDEGTLVLVDPSAQGYKELARARVLPGHESWGPIALVAGRMIVRDFTTMACLDVAAGKP
jgi:outer membrane protein assembly factor BamB